MESCSWVLMVDVESCLLVSMVLVLVVTMMDAGTILSPGCRQGGGRCEGIWSGGGVLVSTAIA